MNNNVVMIKRELLHPHPDNPRKDLGDLAELTESIKEHGVMQNLTVVPDGDKYKVLQDILKDEFDYHPRKEWETILDGSSELYVKEAKK